MGKELTRSNTTVMWTREQMELITRTVAKGATMDELSMFLYQANKMGLDPLANQIFFTKHNTKDGPKVTIIVSINGYRSIAERTRELAGIDDAIFDDGEKYEKEPAQPKKATVTVWRMVKGVRYASTASARWAEYKPADNKDFMWKKMPYSQLAKCAEVLALRKAFPTDLSGTYIEEEMSQSVEQQPATVVETKKEVSEECVECGYQLTSVQAEYSQRMFGKVICRECQQHLPDKLINPADALDNE